MAQWQYPTNAYKKYVPGGGFLRGLGRGIQQFGQGASQWAAQKLVIQQYEAEKEEKRLQRQREAAAAKVEALAKQYEEERQLKIADMVRQQDFENRKALIKYAAFFKDKDKKEEDLRGEMEKTISGTYSKLGTNVGRRLFKLAEAAFRAGDYGKVAQIYRQVDINAERGLLSEMVPTQETDAKGNLSTVMKPADDYGLLKSSLSQMMYGVEKMTGKRPESTTTSAMGGYSISPNQMYTELTKYKSLKEQLQYLNGLSDADAALGFEVLMSPEMGITQEEIDEMLNKLAQ